MAGMTGLIHSLILACILSGAYSVLARNASTVVTESVYYWGVGDPSELHCRECLFFAGEADVRDGQLDFHIAPLPEQLPQCDDCVAVFRFSPSVLRSVLADERSRRLAREAILRWHNVLTEFYRQSLSVQLDADCPASLMPSYLSFVQTLKPLFEGKLSLTIIASWLKPASMTELARLDIPLYVMLYTLAPARDYDDWGGEVPADSFVAAVKDLKRNLDEKIVPADLITVVLPCYYLVTIFDNRGKRIVRSSRTQWIAGMDKTHALLPVKPLPRRLRPAIGQLNLWRVQRTGLYANHILRGGSIVVLEQFDLTAWKTATDAITDDIKAPLKFSVFHLGGRDG